MNRMITVFIMNCLIVYTVGVSGGFIAGTLISLILLLVAVVLIVGVSIYLVKEPTYNFLNKK